MRFDTILQRDEGPAIAAEIAALRSPRRILARGVEQDRTGRARRFQVMVDEPGKAWVLDRQGSGGRESYSDGVVHNVDGEMKVAFASSSASARPVRMATPELFLQWGDGERGDSFFPMLIQPIGSHSILLTFQHEADPAYRTTMVIDERDGIARRRYQRGQAIVITDVRVMADDEPIPVRPRFPKLDGPIPANY